LEPVYLGFDSLFFIAVFLFLALLLFFFCKAVGSVN